MEKTIFKMKRLFCSKKKKQWRKLVRLDIDNIDKLLEPTEILIPARVSRVIDGDTIEIVFLHGGKIPTKISIRIKGVDTPELRGKTDLEKKAAIFVKEKVEEVLNDQKIIQVKFVKWGKYSNRIIGDVIFNQDSYLSDFLLANGYAQVYKGKRKNKWTQDKLQEIIKSYPS